MGISLTPEEQFEIFGERPARRRVRRRGRAALGRHRRVAAVADDDRGVRPSTTGSRSRPRPTRTRPPSPTRCAPASRSTAHGRARSPKRTAQMCQLVLRLLPRGAPEPRGHVRRRRAVPQALRRHRPGPRRVRPRRDRHRRALTLTADSSAMRSAAQARALARAAAHRAAASRCGQATAARAATNAGTQVSTSCGGVRGGQLHADAGLALRHDRVAERDHVHAVRAASRRRSGRRAPRRRTSPARSGARPAAGRSPPRSSGAGTARCSRAAARARRPTSATRSSAASEPATTDGATAFENRYGRERCRSSSTISARAAT